MMMFSTSVTGTPAFCASWVEARFWSRRVIAVMLVGEIRLKRLAAIIALVLQGFPTTQMVASAAATSSIASPCATKMRPLSLSRSARSMPGPRGLEPTSRIQSASPKATRGVAGRR